MAALWQRSAEASARALPGAQARLREEESGASTGVAEKAMRSLELLYISKGVEMSESLRCIRYGLEVGSSW